ncbi:unnamed protein product [Pedinophyceae sp. YPF-701]|nr:unnamed protein product [Pedinophyceae sp. YPF-701]
MSGTWGRARAPGLSGSTAGRARRKSHVTRAPAHVAIPIPEDDAQLPEEDLGLPPGTAILDAGGGAAHATRHGDPHSLPHEGGGEGPDASLAERGEFSFKVEDSGEGPHFWVARRQKGVATPDWGSEEEEDGNTTGTATPAPSEQASEDDLRRDVSDLLMALEAGSAATAHSAACSLARRLGAQRGNLRGVPGACYHGTITESTARIVYSQLADGAWQRVVASGLLRKSTDTHLKSYLRDLVAAAAALHRTAFGNRGPRAWADAGMGRACFALLDEGLEGNSVSMSLGVDILEGMLSVGFRETRAELFERLYVIVQCLILEGSTATASERARLAGCAARELATLSRDEARRLTPETLDAWPRVVAWNIQNASLVRLNDPAAFPAATLRCVALLPANANLAALLAPAGRPTTAPSAHIEPEGRPWTARAASPRAHAGPCFAELLMREAEATSQALWREAAEAAPGAARASEERRAGAEAQLRAIADEVRRLAASLLEASAATSAGQRALRSALLRGGFLRALLRCVTPLPGRASEGGRWVRMEVVERLGPHPDALRRRDEARRRREAAREARRKILEAQRAAREAEEEAARRAEEEERMAARASSEHPSEKSARDLSELCDDIMGMLLGRGRDADEGDGSDDGAQGESGAEGGVLEDGEGEAGSRGTGNEEGEDLEATSGVQAEMSLAFGLAATPGGGVRTTPRSARLDATERLGGLDGPGAASRPTTAGLQSTASNPTRPTTAAMPAFAARPGGRPQTGRPGTAATGSYAGVLGDTGGLRKVSFGAAAAPMALSPNIASAFGHFDDMDEWDSDEEEEEELDNEHVRVTLTEGDVRPLEHMPDDANEALTLAPPDGRAAVGSWILHLITSLEESCTLESHNDQVKALSSYLRMAKGPMVSTLCPIATAQILSAAGVLWLRRVNLAMEHAAVTRGRSWARRREVGMSLLARACYEGAEPGGGSQHGAVLPLLTELPATLIDEIAVACDARFDDAVAAVERPRLAEVLDHIALLPGKKARGKEAIGATMWLREMLGVDLGGDWRAAGLRGGQGSRPHSGRAGGGAATHRRCPLVPLVPMSVLRGDFTLERLWRERLRPAIKLAAQFQRELDNARAIGAARPRAPNRGIMWTPAKDPRPVEPKPPPPEPAPKPEKAKSRKPRRRKFTMQLGSEASRGSILSGPSRGDVSVGSTFRDPSRASLARGKSGVSSIASQSRRSITSGGLSKMIGAGASVARGMSKKIVRMESAMPGVGWAPEEDKPAATSSRNEGDAERIAKKKTRQRLRFASEPPEPAATSLQEPAASKDDDGDDGHRTAFTSDASRPTTAPSSMWAEEFDGPVGHPSLPPAEDEWRDTWMELEPQLLRVVMLLGQGDLLPWDIVQLPTHAGLVPALAGPAANMVAEEEVTLDRFAATTGGRYGRAWPPKHDIEWWEQAGTQADPCPSDVHPWYLRPAPELSSGTYHKLRGTMGLPEAGCGDARGQLRRARSISPERRVWKTADARRPMTVPARDGESAPSEGDGTVDGAAELTSSDEEDEEIGGSPSAAAASPRDARSPSLGPAPEGDATSEHQGSQAPREGSEAGEAEPAPEQEPAQEPEPEPEPEPSLPRAPIPRGPPRSALRRREARLRSAQGSRPKTAPGGADPFLRHRESARRRPKPELDGGWSHVFIAAPPTDPEPLRFPPVFRTESARSALFRVDRNSVNTLPERWSLFSQERQQAHSERGQLRSYVGTQFEVVPPPRDPTPPPSTNLAHNGSVSSISDTEYPLEEPEGVLASEPSMPDKNEEDLAWEASLGPEVWGMRAGELPEGVDHKTWAEQLEEIPRQGHRGGEVPVKPGELMVWKPPVDKAREQIDWKAKLAQKRKGTKVPKKPVKKDPLADLDDRVERFYQEMEARTGVSMRPQTAPRPGPQAATLPGVGGKDGGAARPPRTAPGGSRAAQARSGGPSRGPQAPAPPRGRPATAGAPPAATPVLGRPMTAGDVPERRRYIHPDVVVPSDSSYAAPSPYSRNFINKLSETRDVDMALTEPLHRDFLYTGQGASALQERGHRGVSARPRRLE